MTWSLLRNPSWKAGVAALLAAGIAVAATAGCSPPEQGSIKLKGTTADQSERINNPLATAKDKAPAKGGPTLKVRDIKNRRG